MLLSAIYDFYSRLDIATPRALHHVWIPPPISSLFLLGSTSYGLSTSSWPLLPMDCPLPIELWTLLPIWLYPLWTLYYPLGSASYGLSTSYWALPPWARYFHWVLPLCNLYFLLGFLPPILTSAVSSSFDRSEGHGTASLPPERNGQRGHVVP